MAGRVVWNQAALSFIERGAPQIAHKDAVQHAANKGADMVHSTYSGSLARALSRPRHQGLLRSLVGSDLPYTSTEGKTGTTTIHGKPLLYIRDRRRTASGRKSRSKTAGKIVAVKSSVRHVGKGFFEAMVHDYNDQVMARLRALL